MSNAQELLQERAKRIQDAVALKKPDRVPIVSMWDFFPAKWKGLTVKEVMYDYQLLFDVWAECMEHFKPDLSDNPFALRGFGPVLDALDFQQLKWAGHGPGRQHVLPVCRNGGHESRRIRPFPFRSF